MLMAVALIAGTAISVAFSQSAERSGSSPQAAATVAAPPYKPTPKHGDYLTDAALVSQFGQISDPLLSVEGTATGPATPLASAEAPQTVLEQQGSWGADTFSNPTNASGRGPRIQPMQWVEVSCKLKPAGIIDSTYPDGYWYRIQSPPWSGRYYAVANMFFNGDVPGHTPYTHNTDFDVPDC